MSTLFISDCHLDPARPHIIEHFLDFLNHRVRTAARLFILGDLFDYWLGDDDPAEGLAQVLDALATRAPEVPIGFIAGNRDFLVGAGFAKRTGCRLLPDTYVIELDGRATLLMHGDLLCTDDRPYQRYRHLIRHPLTQAAAGKLSLGLRRRLAGKLRVKSTQEVKRKPDEIMDANQQTVMDYMCRYNVDQLIHGHTHRPALHEFTLNERPARRIVLGDWYEQGSVLEMTNGHAELHKLPVAEKRSKSGLFF